MFDTGSLRHTVVFKKNTRGSLGFGSKDHFETFLTTRCSLEKKRAMKAADRGKVEIASFYRMVCRFEVNLFNQLSGSCVCEINSEVYVVHDFNVVDERKHLYEFIIAKMAP